MSLRVAVVGDALLDLTIEPSGPMRPGGDVPASVRVGPGGQGANVAVRLARRGVNSRLGCALSDDVAGRLLLEALESDGVRAHPVRVPATGAVAILLGVGGERTMLSQRARLVPGIDLADLTAEAEWLVISGYALLEPEAHDFARRCAALPVRRAVIGCSLSAEGAGAWRDAVIAAQPDLLILNHDEALALARQEADAESLASALASDLGALVMVTSRGAAAIAGSELRLSVVAPIPSAATVDTTGAGDAFAAAVIAELGLGWPLIQASARMAVTRALAAAGEVAGVHGAQTPVPSERSAVSG